MPFSDATVSREAEKVQAWYADAQQRAAGGEDTSQLLMASLEADIQQEIQRASARLKGGSGASSRLYQDAQRRAHKAASHPAFESSAGSLVQYASALSFEERSAVQARNAELLEGMEARKKAEVRRCPARVLGPPAPPTGGPPADRSTCAQGRRLTKAPIPLVPSASVGIIPTPPPEKNKNKQALTAHPPRAFYRESTPQAHPTPRGRALPVFKSRDGP
jgi:hypothetical protein